MPALGAAVTVTVRVAVALEQPPVPVTVYVITEVPAVNPLIAPVDALIVATAGVPLLHEPPETVDVKVVLPPTQIPWVPLRVPALGAVVTVTVRVAVASAQPPVPVTV